MLKYNKINDLMNQGGSRLNALKSQSEQRSHALRHVCAALPEKLARSVASAGVQEGELTIGVVGAAWASRLRYVTETLRKRVGDAMGVELKTVRIKVVPPPKTSPPGP